MNPFLVVALVAGGILLLNIKDTVKTALKLDYQILTFGIYNFIKNGNIVFRVRIRFTNTQKTPIHVQLINISAYWGAKFTTNADGSVADIQSRGTVLGTVADNTPFTIDANAFTTKAFYIECTWLNLLKIFGTSILENIQNSTRFVEAIAGKPLLISGQIKAEGFSIPVQTSINLTNESN